MPERLRETAEAIWRAGVERVGGRRCVADWLEKHPDLNADRIVAVGKAAADMAGVALERYAGAPCLVVTKYGHTSGHFTNHSGCVTIESGHPVPDVKSLEAGEALIRFVDAADADETLLMLVSGGASSLAEALPEDMTLGDLQALTGEMLAGGLDIHAINARRREISQIKAGKLLGRFNGERAVVLAISDVGDDCIEVIGSGIGSVSRLKNGEVTVIASNAVARQAAADQAESDGLPVIANAENLHGELRAVAARCAEAIRSGQPGVYLYGGEPLVQLPQNPGEGGRNQALALAMAKELAGMEGVGVLVAGTDGTDGPTGSAGGFVTGQDWQRVPGGDEALAAADSASWLRKSGGLFMTGPTGTNVMDLMVAVKR